MPDEQHKPEPRSTDPAQMAKLLELELLQKRMAWQQAKARRGNFRAIAFLFLFAILVGALWAFYMFLEGGGMEKMRARQQDTTTTTTIDVAP
jgi:hypothetical protein